MNRTPQKPGWLKRQSQTAAASVYHDPETEKLIREFLRNLDMNFDCDMQGRIHASYCRSCEAKTLLALISGEDGATCTT